MPSLTPTALSLTFKLDVNFSAPVYVNSPQWACSKLYTIFIVVFEEGAGRLLLITLLGTASGITD